jgi:hypothetical protein
MQKILRVLKPTGLCLLTVPVGVDGIYVPWHRIYGPQRLPKLLQGFDVIKSRFYAKKPFGPWQEADRSTALAFEGDATRFAVGQFVLRPRLRPTETAP